MPSSLYSKPCFQSGSIHFIPLYSWRALAAGTEELVKHGVNSWDVLNCRFEALINVKMGTRATSLTSAILPNTILFIIQRKGVCLFLSENGFSCCIRACSWMLISAYKHTIYEFQMVLYKKHTPRRRSSFVIHIVHGLMSVKQTDR